MPINMVTTLSYANAIRTRNLTVGPSGQKIDFSFLSDDEEIVSITIIPAKPDSIEFSGKDGDDWVNIGAGITLDIDFELRYTQYIPKLRSTTGGTEQVSLIITIRA
mgnify:CR=1 FL=1